jgi:hypothetical protein
MRGQVRNWRLRASFGCQPINGGRLDDRVSRATHLVPTQVVDEHEDDVRPLVARLRFRAARCSDCRQRKKIPPSHFAHRS